MTTIWRIEQRRVAQAFDFACITDNVGAPFFAQFAKGGSHERIRNLILAEGTAGCVGSISSRPCKERKNGAPSSQIV